MKRTIKLRNVCACGIPAALDALAEEVMRRAGRNHRPCPQLIVLKVERDMVPLAIDPPDCLVTYGLFSEPPSPYNPRGKRVLGITTHICAACPNLHPDGTGGGDQPQGPKRHHGRCHDQCQARCHGCPHACWAELTLYIKLTPEFPFPPDDVEGFLYRYFNMHDLAAAKIDKDYDFLYDVTRRFQPQAPGVAPAAGDDIPNLPGDEAGDAAGVTDAPATSQPAPQPAQRGKPGAPQLHCNVWLFGQVRVLPDPRQCSHLKPRWKELYMEEVGVEPEDWDKSFRAAARYCRMLIARGHGGLPA